MKVKLIRKASTRNPAWDKAEAEKCRVSGVPYRVPYFIDVEAGTVIDDPEAWKLIGLGYAEPEDEEARVAAGMTDAEIAAAVEAQDEMQNSFDKKVRKARKKQEKAADQTV